MKIMEPNAVHDFYGGVITGTAVKTGVKRLRDMIGAYKEAGEAEDLDRVMYEVYSFENGDPAQAGNLNWGLTVMYPELVGGGMQFYKGTCARRPELCGDLFRPCRAGTSAVHGSGRRNVGGEGAPGFPALY